MLHTTAPEHLTDDELLLSTFCVIVKILTGNTPVVVTMTIPSVSSVTNHTDSAEVCIMESKVGHRVKLDVTTFISGTTTRGDRRLCEF